MQIYAEKVLDMLSTDPMKRLIMIQGQRCWISEPCQRQRGQKSQIFESNAWKFEVGPVNVRQGMQCLGSFIPALCRS